MTHEDENRKERVFLVHDLIAIKLKLPDGSGYVERRFTTATIEAMPISLDDFKDKIDQLFPMVTEPRRSWDNPQDPITYTGTIKPGKEEEVAKLLEELPS